MDTDILTPLVQPNQKFQDILYKWKKHKNCFELVAQIHNELAFNPLHPIYSNSVKVCPILLLHK